MPLVQTRGAASAQGFGEFSQQTAVNYIEDVFSTYLYTGTGATQTITNGIDLAGKGGLVWTKGRSSAINNWLYSTPLGTGGTGLLSNTTDNNTIYSDYNGISSYNSNGFTFSVPAIQNQSNLSGSTYCSWTFRKQAKFFDIVTYTGTGSAQTINHNLGSTPGMMIVKCTSSTSNWNVYHVSQGATKYGRLNLTNGFATLSTIWNNTAPTSTQFTVGSSTAINNSGDNYVVYLFANDAGGFGTTGTDNVISCGTFNWSGSDPSVEVNLGYEPQFVLAKSVGDGTNWVIMDTMRSLSKGSSATTTSAGLNKTLYPNLASAETTPNDSYLTSTGFSYFGPAGDVIYMAIRRPMKVPTDATTVFNLSTVGSGTFATNGFPTDFYLGTATTGLAKNDWDRLRGGKCLFNNLTNGESAFNYAPYLTFDNNTQFKQTADGNIDINYYFSRRPKFFDTVCYTGTGTATTQAHNLGVAPEMMIIKKRSSTGDWFVYSATGIDTGKTYPYPRLNGDEDGWFGSVAINSTAPTSSVFTISSILNTSASTYVASLFATCPGVSKVGSYTGNGTTQAIACGFTGGARFVIIKRTDATSGWYLYDTARGMTTLVDPYLFVNDTSAQTATLGSVTTTTGGFTLNSTILAAINVSGGTYIFLAIA